MKVEKQIVKGLAFAAFLLGLEACTAQTQAPRENQIAPFGSPGQMNPGYPDASFRGVSASTRQITFNGRPLTAQEQARVEMQEQSFGTRLLDGNYWYDNRTGAIGHWGGPAEALIQPGLGLGGPMPPNASGGGTGMFVNGRELHPIDVARLGGAAVSGRFWLDANGNYGFEGGPVLGNLMASGRGGNGGHPVYAPGEIGGGVVNEGGACFAGAGCAYPQ